jgi:ClpP class serine protease
MSDLLWLFFLIASLQPIVTQKILEVARLRIMRRLERARNSRVIALVHRQETMSFLGFPVMRYIDVNDSEEVLRAIKLTDPDTPIDLILHTPGGLVLAAAQIAHALKRHRAKVAVLVPHSISTLPEATISSRFAVVTGTQLSFREIPSCF